MRGVFIQGEGNVVASHVCLALNAVGCEEGAERLKNLLGTKGGVDMCSEVALNVAAVFNQGRDTFISQATSCQHVGDPKRHLMFNSLHVIWLEARWMKFEHRIPGEYVTTTTNLRFGSRRSSMAESTAISRSDFPSDQLHIQYTSSEPGSSQT